MNTTIRYIERIKARHGTASDYAVAKLLGIAPQLIYNWRAGKTISDPIALKVAALLEIPGLSVLSSQHAERTDCPEAAALMFDSALARDPLLFKDL